MERSIHKLFVGADRYIRQKQFTKAVNLLTSIIHSGKATQQDKANVYIKRGNTYHEQRQYKKAIDDYEQAAMLATDTNTRANAYVGEGTAYFHLSRYDEAEAAYEQAIKLARDSHIKINARWGINIVNKARNDTANPTRKTL